jgi:multidrug efflux pump subunit AcrB
MAERDTRDFNVRLVEWFTKNTQLVALVFLCIVIGGVFSFLNLRSEAFPSADINVAVITDIYRGASATEVEQQLVKPLEASVQTIKGVKDVTSTASSNFANLTVSFDATVDFKSVLSELRSKVQSTILPQDADKPEVSVPDFSGNQSYYAVTTADGISAARLAGDKVRAEIEALPEVKQFRLVSDLNDQVEIHWRPAALISSGLSTLQLQQALAANNVTLPAGVVQVDGADTSVVTNSSFKSIDDLSALIVSAGTGRTGKIIHLSDVATILPVLSSKDVIQRVGFRDGAAGVLLEQPGLLYQLSLKPNADVLKTDSKVIAAIDRAKSNGNLHGAHVITVFSAAEQVRIQVNEIVGGAIGGKIGTGPLSNLGYALGGIWLVILVMLLFVNWRVGLISALVIPLSLLFTMLSLKLLGITLNTLTLFSMILVLGLVVDPAIVVLEAIQREMDLGKKGRDAVLHAVTSIGSGVFMSVLTSVIVFLPFAVVSGTFGQIIRYIPFTVIPALIASYFTPLLFLTYLAQRFLKPQHAPADDELSNLWKSSQWFIRINRSILQKKWRQVFVLLVAFAATVAVTGTLFATKKISFVQFSSTKDVLRMNVTVTYPRNFTKERKIAIVSQLDPILESESYIDSYFPLMQSDTGITLTLNLVPRDQRSADSSDLIPQLQTRIDALNNVSEKIRFDVQSDQVGPPTQAFPVAVNIYGDNLNDIKKAAIRTGDILRSQPKVTQVEDGFTNVANPEIRIELDRAKVQSSGLSSIQVGQILGSVLGNNPVTKFEQTIQGTDRSTEVVLINSDHPGSVEAIGNTILMVGPAGPVLVKDVAAVSQAQGFAGINRLNGSRYVTVQAKVADPIKDAAGAQKAVQEFWTKDKLAEYNLRADALQDKGSGNEFIQSFKDLFLALAVAVLLTYIVLVLFFGSFSQPFIIILAVPLSFIGVFPALASVGGQFGFLEILGIITLVGIVENVGIFVIDLANRKQKDGMEYREAIAQATGIRFRPIFLTKVTALGGLLPLMILSPFWRSLAVVVVAGILTSGVLSLFTTPILYSWFWEIKGWVSRMGHRRSSHTSSNGNE